MPTNDEVAVCLNSRRLWIARGLAGVSRVAAVPGFYALVADPMLRRFAGTREIGVRRYGSQIHLHLGDYVQRRIFCWSLNHPELVFTQRWCRRGDTMIDVGANVGVFTLAAAAAVGSTGKVISIEPNPRVLRQLTRNVALNAYDNIEIVRVAVGDHDGVLQIGMVDERQGSGAVSATGTLDAVTVPQSTLDRLLEQRPRARLLKIDVEGFERPVLQGAHNTLSGPLAPEVILIEINEVALGRLGSSGEQVCSLLADYGYQLFRRSQVGALRGFHPMRAADVEQRRAVLSNIEQSHRHRLNRRRWTSILLTDIVAIHPQTSTDEVKRAYQRRRPDQTRSPR